MCSGFECWGDVYPMQSPESGVETVTRMPFFPHCHSPCRGLIARWLWCLTIRSRQYAVIYGCAGNGHSPGETQDARKLGVPPGEKCAEDSGYIRPDSVVESPVYVWSVTVSLLFGSPLRRVWGVQQPPLPSRDPTWIVLVGVWLSCRLVWWCIMSSGRKLPMVDWAGATPTTSPTLPGTFLGLALDLRSDRLYVLVDEILDVMGLRAIEPSAAIVKVMSAPNSCSVRVVTPDDHVNIGFHEILIQDLEDEELPFVAMRKPGCLRLDWPKTLFTFMSIYQFDLD